MKLWLFLFAFIVGSVKEDHYWNDRDNRNTYRTGNSLMTIHSQTLKWEAAANDLDTLSYTYTYMYFRPNSSGGHRDSFLLLLILIQVLFLGFEFVYSHFVFDSSAAKTQMTYT